MWDVLGGLSGEKVPLRVDNKLILKVGHALVWDVIGSKLFSFMQITCLYKLTINKVTPIKEVITLQRPQLIQLL